MIDYNRSPDLRDEIIHLKTVFIFTLGIFMILIIVLLGAFLQESITTYNNLVIEYDNLEQINLELCDINTQLLYDNEELMNKVISQEEQIAELEKQTTQNLYSINKNNNSNNNFSSNDSVKGSAISSSNYGSKKTYMYYTSITNKSSPQWSIQTKATTNSYGVRVINEDSKEYACVAIGTGWGYGVGTKLEVQTTNGSFYAIVGDIKADSHTRADNLVGTDGSIVEFIVDKNLNSNAKKMGNLNVIADYSGEVTNIVRA